MELAPQHFDYSSLDADTARLAKDQILDQVQQATEEKGKPLTEKEIKELPLVQKIAKKLFSGNHCSILSTPI